MNSNALSGNWLKKLDAENNFFDKSGNNVKNVSSGNNFQSFLNNQLEKSNVLDQRREVDATRNNDDKRMAAKSVLKNVNTTAAKLSVKSPEKPKDNTAPDISGNEVAESDAPKVTKSLDSEPSESIEVTVATKPNEAVELPSDDLETKETVTPDALMQLMQQILNQLEVATNNKTDPTGTQTDTGELEKQLQALIALISSSKTTIDQKVDSKLIENVQTTFEGILSSSDMNKNIKPELMQVIKTITDDLKASKEVKSTNVVEDTSKISESKVTDFAKTLSDLKETKSQTQEPAIADALRSKETVKADSQNVIPKAVNPTMAAPVNGESADSNIKETAVNLPETTEKPQEALALAAKGKVDPKAQIVITNEQNGVSESTNQVNFNAKLESSSVAFGKVELTNQATKNSVQQNIMDQLINSPKMQFKQTEQGTMMTMKLNPEVLGNVEIKMEIIKGVLQAEIKVENMIVKGAIESSLIDLKNALSEKGYQVESLNVSVGKESQNGNSQPHQQNHESRQNRGNSQEEHELQKSEYGFEKVVKDTQIDYRG